MAILRENETVLTDERAHPQNIANPPLLACDSGTRCRDLAKRQAPRFAPAPSPSHAVDLPAPPTEWAMLVHTSRGAVLITTGDGIGSCPSTKRCGFRRASSTTSMGGPARRRARSTCGRERAASPATPRGERVAAPARAPPPRVLQPGTRSPEARAASSIAVLLDELAVLPVARRSISPCRAIRRALRAARHVRRSPALRHSLADVARHAGAARALERLFREETGMSFGTWRQRTRFLRAATPRRGREATTTALAVGYEHERVRRGVSAGDWRHAREVLRSHRRLAINGEWKGRLQTAMQTAKGAKRRLQRDRKRRLQTATANGDCKRRLQRRL